MDTITKAKRRALMALILSSDTEPEKMLRWACIELGSDSDYALVRCPILRSQTAEK